MKQCPKCEEMLTSRTVGGIELDECPKCKGVWYDRDELRRSKDAYDSDLNWMDFEIWKHEDQFRSAPCALACPVCRESMVTIEYGQSRVVIDYCPSCKGTWLEKGEFKKIIDALEKELLTKSFPDYMKETLQEGLEVITGPESFLSEWKDFSNILRFMQYRLFVENPVLLNTMTSIQSSVQ